MKKQFTLYLCEPGVDEASEVIEYDLIQPAISNGMKAVHKGKNYFIFDEVGLCVASGRAISSKK